MIHVFKEQVHQKGYYSEIELNINFDENEPLELLINYSADPRWETACRAGALIFFEYYSKRKVGRLNVKIEDIKWYPVETNNLIILFTTILALSKELDFEINNFKFEKDNLTFMFPEARTLLQPK